MYIGIDLGGTNIAAGVIDKAGHIVFQPWLKDRLRKLSRIWRICAWIY